MGQKRIFGLLTIFSLQILPQRANMIKEEKFQKPILCFRGLQNKVISLLWSDCVFCDFYFY